MNRASTVAALDIVIEIIPQRCVCVCVCVCLCERVWVDGWVFWLMQQLEVFHRIYSNMAT